MVIALPRDGTAARAWHRWRPYLLLLAYLLVVTLLQRAVSPTVELDQAEQLVLGQRFSLGYTNQPPLYTWLVWAVGSVTGRWVDAVWGIKIALLALFVVACDRAGHVLGLSIAQRRVAAAGLALLPAIVWEAQRDLTHSLLAVTMAACVLWSVLASLARPAWWRDVLSGVLVGAAMLSKPNVVVFLAVLPAVLLLWPQTRRQVRWQSLPIVAVVGALVWAPHGWWLWTHPQALARSVEKLQRTDVSWGGMWGGLALAVLTFSLPWALLAAPMAWRTWRMSAGGGLLSRLLVGVAVCVLLMVPLVGIGDFNPRWLLSMLFFLPLWLAACTNPQAGRWGRAMVVAGLVSATLCAVILPARIVWPAFKPTRQNLPYAELVAALRHAGGGVPPVVMATNHLVGGNIKATLGDEATVLAPVWRTSPRAHGEVLFVAREEDLGDEAVRAWFQQQTGQRLDDVAWQGRVAAPMLYRPRGPLVVLKWARLSLPQNAGH